MKPKSSRLFSYSILDMKDDIDEVNYLKARCQNTFEIDLMVVETGTLSEEFSWCDKRP